MTPTTLDRGLALTVALRLDRSHEQCAAWIESADRVCGRDALRPWLCKRHETVAKRRLEKEVAQEKAQAEQARQRAEEQRPAREARLAQINARLDQIDPFRADGNADTAAMCAPLSQRLPSDTRIAELARLYRERDALMRTLRTH
ncbi:hypothetical protein CFK39_15915 (plasmid) [Brachybacterium avium]|uniref:Uncharacterized protein n=1 Tax=Brachybacterium avium TaxID=2017485 RepID=A0A220UI10_9MICO|nr:hypothetical protein [Brachybacterium avium]ASK67333.1 hypothetical protein CFK39_15915 [Brachybacterium avium]